MGTWEDELNHYEQELLALLRDSRTKWTTIYLCLQRLRDEHLYQGEHLSTWIRGFCSNAGCSESRLWDALRAGNFYSAWAANREDAPKLADLDVDPQNLIVMKRIAFLDPSRIDNLMAKLLKKQVRRRDLLEISVRLKLKIERERFGITASDRSWREMDLKQAPYYGEYSSLMQKISVYYDSASIDGCRRIVEALQSCVDQIEQNGL